MIVEATSHGARAGRFVRFVLLVLFTLYIGHDAVFVAQYGIGPRLDAAMAETGHAPHWLGFGVLALAAGAVLLLRAAGVLASLASRAGRRRRVRSVARQNGRLPVASGTGGYLREVVDLWPPLLVATLATFALLENIEHLGAEGHLLGVGALTGPEYSLAIPVLSIVTGVVAAVGALVRWRILTLKHRVTRADPPTPVAHRAAPTPIGWRTVAAERMRRRLLDRPDPGRAPPALAGA